MRILVVEDDPKIASFLDEGFAQSGFSIDAVTTAEAAWELASSARFDLAVVDLMLPGSDGLSLVERLRSAGNPIPVIVLSAKRAVEERIRCLERGADDFVPKPFAFGELLARTQAVVRRVRGSSEQRTLALDDLTMDLSSRELFLAGERIDLQPREFMLLEHFLRNPGRLFSKAYFLERFWGYNVDPQTNVIDVLVCRLRKKVEREGAPKRIHTVRGAGYVYRPQ
jgi:two-component system OmpR family response regulator